MAAKVAVIIITYNAEIWIKDCLDSFLGTLPEGSIVIIADNQSNDSTLSILGLYNDKIHLEPLSQNLGFGRANNIAIDIARAKNVDYLFLLNQDTVVTPGAITTLIEAAENHPQFGVISPLHIFDDKSLDSNFETYLLQRSTRPFSQFMVQKKDIIEVDFVNAAAWLIPARVIEKVGGFDPLFQHYGEDSDWAKRCKFHGYKIGVVPSAKIFHLRTQTRTVPTGKKWMNRSERRQLMYFKDPQKTYIQAFSKSLRWTIRVIIKEVPFLRLDLFFALLWGWSKGILKSKTARLHRKMEMNRHGQWLKN